MVGEIKMWKGSDQKLVGKRTAQNVPDGETNLAGRGGLRIQEEQDQKTDWGHN